MNGTFATLKAIERITMATLACANEALQITSDIDLSGDSAVLTGAQIRAARALLRWNNFELSEKSKVSFAAIQRAQAVDGPPNMLLSTANAIKTAFERAGVVFINRGDYGGGGVGVRLRK